MMARRKVYIIEIEDCSLNLLNPWYKQHSGKRFHASFGIYESATSEKVPAFILNEPPFFHVLPLDCCIVEEVTYTTNAANEWVKEKHSVCHIVDL